MKKALSLILVFIMLCTFIAACSSGGETGSNSSETKSDEKTAEMTETEPEETLPPYNYPNVDYEGHTFVILNQEDCNWANCHIAPDELNGELINDALYNRNVAVEDRCNIKITEVRTAADDPAALKTNAVKTITAGDALYDMIAFPINELGGVLTNGYFVDLLTVGEMQLNEPWWDKIVVENGTLNDRLYFASSDISLFPFEATWIIYFDETALDNLGLEYPYELVRSGSWTFDSLIEYAKAGASLNGADSFKYEFNSAATYGMITHNQFIMVMLCGANEMMVDIDENSMPYFTGDNQRFYSVAAKITELTKPDGYYLDRANTTIEAADNLVATEYHKQRFLFMSETLGHIANLRDLEHDFGVVPIPKYEESQDSYHSMIATWGTLLTTIPVTNMEIERTGVILDMLAYQSYISLMEPYYETYLTQKGTRNENSAEMLQIIRDTRTLNTGYLFGWTTDICSTLVTKLAKGDGEISADVAKQVEKIKTKIDKTMAYYTE